MKTLIPLMANLIKLLIKKNLQNKSIAKSVKYRA